MRELLVTLLFCALLSGARCALSERHDTPRCSWVSPYRNTLQRDTNRRWECRP